MTIAAPRPRGVIHHWAEILPLTPQTPRISLGEGDTQNHVRLDRPAGFRVAADGFEGATRQHTDADARPDGSEAHGEAGANCLPDLRVDTGTTSGGLKEGNEPHQVKQYIHETVILRCALSRRMIG